MTPLRQNAILRRVKDITLGTTLGVALLNGSVMLQSCGSVDRADSSTSAEDSDYDRTEKVETFKKGVRTFITETAPGKFKITDEQQVQDPALAAAIVNYYDGHRDTLSVDAAKKLVQTDESTRHYFNNSGMYRQHHGNGLANALLWGSMGYMLGRNNRMGGNVQDENRYRSGVYASPGVFGRSSGIGSEVSRSRVVSSRPSGGRGGFFSGRSGRGFSG
jgi:hypothetical protein